MTEKLSEKELDTLAMFTALLGKPEEHTTLASTYYRALDQIATLLVDQMPFEEDMKIQLYGYVRPQFWSGFLLGWKMKEKHQ